jgi:hypothetical protein
MMSGFESSDWKLTLKQDDRSAVIVHHVNKDGVWASQNRRILFRSPNEMHWRTIGRFPFAAPRDYLLASRIMVRILRTDRCNLFPTRLGVLLGIRRGTVYSIHGDMLRPLFSIRGDSVLLMGITETLSGNVYFGEYSMNPYRLPVRIWRVKNDLSTYEIAHEFESGSIRHVHGIYSDPYHPRRLWVTVGDFEGECFIFYTDDEFSTLNRLGDGTQLWRAVGLLFREDAVFWLTDTELEQNKIVSLDRRTLTLTLHGDVHSPTWYSTQTTDGLFVAATTVERGPGVQANRAWLMVSEDAENWHKVLSFRKDMWPLQPFKFGVMSFASGSYDSDNIWISGEALVGLDGRSILCSINKKKE